MPTTISLSLQTGALALGVVGTAAGLNLSVMAIGRDASERVPEQLAAVASAQDSGDPEVMQITVDVPVPAAETIPDTAIAQSAVPAQATPPAPTTPPQTNPAPAAPWPTVPPLPVPTAAPTAPAPTAAPTNSPTTPAPTASPATTVPPPSTTPTTSSETTVPPTLTEYLTYTFDGVAGIVIAFHNGEELEFWSASPESGWGYQVEKNEADVVEIKFRRVVGEEGEAKFKLSLDNGELEVKKEY